MQANERLAIVIEGQKESNTVKEVCEKHGISRDTYYRWKKEIDEAVSQYYAEKSPGRKGEDDFESKSEAESAYQEKKQELKEKDKEIYELKKQLEGTTIQRDFYKFRLELDAKKNSEKKKNDGS